MRSIASQATTRPLLDNVTPFSRLQIVATFSTRFALRKKDVLPPRPKVSEEDTFKRYLKGSGPGGQKINKTSSAVQLTHVPTGIVVKSQATRSRTQNESIARRILAEKVELLEKGSESRVEKKRERDSRKKRSAEKKSRRKYRTLAEEKAGQGVVQNAEADQESEEDNEFQEYDAEVRKDFESEIRPKQRSVNCKNSTTSSASGSG